MLRRSDYTKDRERTITSLSARQGDPGNIHSGPGAYEQQDLTDAREERLPTGEWMSPHIWELIPD